MTKRLTTEALRERLKTIKLLTLDVDGVLTDGGLYYADDGSQLRKFNVKDGMGMKLAREAGVEIAIITASHAPAIQHRGDGLGIPHVFVGVEHKLSALTTLCADLDISLEDVAHIGDDVNDLPVLCVVGVALTVADAVDEVLETAIYATTRNGGAGAVREICDLIVQGRG